MKNFFKQLGKGLLYFVLFIAIQFIVSFVIQFIVSYQVGFETAKAGAGAQLSAAELMPKIMDRYMPLITLIALISGVLTIIVLVIEFLIRKKNFFSETAICKIKPSVLIPIFVFGIALNVLISIIMQLLPIPQDLMNSYIQQSSNLTSGNLVVNILGTTLVAPIVEEIIFRGLLLTRFRKGMPTTVAVILSSLLFGVVHGQIIWMIYTFILGIILSIVFIRTKSLVGNILLHFSFNAVSAVMMIMNIEDVSDGILPILLVISIIVCTISFLAIFSLTKEKKETINNGQPVVSI